MSSDEPIEDLRISLKSGNHHPTDQQIEMTTHVKLKVVAVCDATKTTRNPEGKLRWTADLTVLGVEIIEATHPDDPD